MLSELTHTSPGAPPGAAGLSEDDVLVGGDGLEVGGAAAAGAGVSTVRVCGGGAVCFAAGAAAGAAAGVAAYHVSTPWWPRHAPCFVACVVNVPSLHLPVAPAGIAPDAGAAAGAAADFVGAVVVFGAGAAVLADADAYQVSTP